MAKTTGKNLSPELGVEYCDFCPDGKVVPQKATINYYRHGRVHVFHDVDAEVCQQCGEKYLHASTLTELDRRMGYAK